LGLARVVTFNLGRRCPCLFSWWWRALEVAPFYARSHPASLPPFFCWFHWTYGTFIIFYVISCGLLGFVSLLSAGRLPGHFIWGQFAKYRLGALLRVGLPAQGGVL